MYNGYVFFTACEASTSNVLAMKMLFVLHVLCIVIRALELGEIT